MPVIYNTNPTIMGIKQVPLFCVSSRPGWPGWTGHVGIAAHARHAELRRLHHHLLLRHERGEPSSGPGCLASNAKCSIGEAGLQVKSWWTTPGNVTIVANANRQVLARYYTNGLPFTVSSNGLGMAALAVGPGGCRT